MGKTVEEKINKVFDGGSTSSLVHLNTKQADKFIDYIVDESAILQKARVIRMNEPIVTIGKIGFASRILHPWTRGTALASSKRAEVTPWKITLTTKEIIAEVKILDDELEDNIEGMSFEQHLMQMIAKQARNELEEAGLYGRISTQDETINQLFDGWIENAGSVIDASDTGVFADRYIDKTKIGKGYKTLKTKFRKWIAFMMHDDLGIDYSDKYEALSTGYNTVGKTSAYGKPFVFAPNMSTESPVAVSSGATGTLSASPVLGASAIVLGSGEGASFLAGDTITLALGKALEFSTTIASVATDTLNLDDAIPFAYDHTDADENVVTETTLDGAEVLISDPRNLLRGIQRNIRIEPERNARERATYFVLTMRIDFQTEETSACAVIKNLKTK